MESYIQTFKSLREGKEYCLYDKKQRKVISFIKGDPLKINAYDILIRDFLRDKNGLYVFPYEQLKFQGRNFVPIDDQQFFEAFLCAFPWLISQDGYYLEIMSID